MTTSFMGLFNYIPDCIVDGGRVPESKDFGQILKLFNVPSLTLVANVYKHLFWVDLENEHKKLS